MFIEEQIAREVRAQKTPKEAAELVAQYPQNRALEIIKALDPLTAAFVFVEFRRRSKTNGGSHKAYLKKKYANELLQRAEELKINGIQGLCAARDQIYRETGYLK